MISAGSHIVPLTSIYVDREKRQRREIGEEALAQLMQSISARGLIHPIVVTREGEVIAGERRFTAITRLGHDSIEVRYVDEVEASELHLIELEENIRRVDVTWQEKTLALKRWHELRIAEDPGWSQKSTAEELGISTTEVSQNLALAKEIASGNERIASADKVSTATNILKRKTERERTSTLAAIEGEAPDARRIPLLHADFHEWAAAYGGVKFNLLHCDFPYGVNADKQQQGSNIGMHGGYADGPDVYFALLDTLEMAMSNVVAEAAHLIFWFSMDYYHVTFERLNAMGWRVNPFPLVWHKTDNTGLLPDPQRGPRRIYETAFFASRGDRLVVQAVSNCFGHAGKDKEIHMSEKPQPMLHHFMRMVCDANSVVLDPTAGSANALKVAEKLGANYVLGLERDREFYERSVAAYHNADETDIGL